MNLLAIDCVSSILSAAVSNGSEVFYSQLDGEMKQSEIIMNCIDDLMKEASLKPAELNGVLCLEGPGSFTGLRIGYSVAKGLALSLSIPFAPIPTLDCIAFSLPENKIKLAVIESRKNAYYYAFYDGNKRLTEDAEADSLELVNVINNFIKKNTEKIFLTGPGSDKLYEILSQDLKQKVILEYEKKGYAKEIIAIANLIKIFDSDCDEYLISGPRYIRSAT
ncbi:MAG: tRNA (adenosine(37)-N6)-threonylcarbamoyltransferase complex dimerization subunit type 1 TsaB [Treponema sp.]|nr:tRNA (adenosine(37)-N6)-threonylcarbamoyltransferase complex dimerization subunit type 1 TsaB [Treponema sp.]